MSLRHATPVMEQIPARQANTNWCCILSTFIVAGGMCFFGVSLALRGDGRTGLVLLLSSGGLLALSICAAIGKFRPGEDKTAPPLTDDPEDRPPSYRLSWRRSFMRRVRHRNDDDEEGGGGGGGGDGSRGGRGRGWWLGRRKRGKEDEGGGGGGRGRGGREGNRTSPRELEEGSHSSSCDSLLEGIYGGGARGGVGDGRYTQSLSNLLDPPSYQDALAGLDDAAIRKLRSEMCLPSAMQ